MTTIIYDYRFNGNEIYTLFLLAAGILLFIKTKKLFPMKESIIYLLYSVFFGLMLDHTISVLPIDFYDVNDTSGLDFMDFLTYLMYGPYGYFFIYFYKRWNIKRSITPIYILLWAFVSLFSEYIGNRIGVYHYKNGYQIYFSFPIYLAVMSLHIFLYQFLQAKKAAPSNGGLPVGPPMETGKTD